MLGEEQRYTNASHVQVSLPLLPQPASYVACQGPLRHTAKDFWQMVMELQIPAVVMLTRCSEKGMTKCWQYFPQSAGEMMEVPGYQILVRNRSRGVETGLDLQQRLLWLRGGVGGSFL